MNDARGNGRRSRRSRAYGETALDATHGRDNMNKEMPMSVEWMPQNAYMHGSLDHLLPADRGQDFIIIKEEAEFYQSSLSAQLQVSPRESDREIKRRGSDPADQADSLNQPPQASVDASEKLYNKGRVDVIEMPVDPTLNCKYLFVYEDQFSKFVVLKALRGDTAKEVAASLLDVLGIIGSPRVLQSGNGRKFAEQVVHELRSLWHGLFVLHGDVSRCEVSYRDFKGSLESWVRKNPTRTWCEGLSHVQITHNSTYRCENGRVPYDVLFRRNACDNFQGVEKDTAGLGTEEEWLERLSDKKGGDAAATTEDAQSASNSTDCERKETARSRDASTKADDVNAFSYVDVKSEPLASNASTVDSTSTDDTDASNELRIDEDSRRNELKIDDGRTLRCKYCQKRYMKIGHLKNHMRSHNAKKVLRCKLCSRLFNFPKVYAKHMKQSHGQDKLADEEREIPVSRSTRSSANALTAVPSKGRSVTRETSEPETTGKDCDSSLDTKEFAGRLGKARTQTGRRKSTAEIRVSKVQSLKCAFCTQTFNFPSVLERHMRSHTNERPYLCQLCNKSFKQLGHLSQHALTHHDYRSFQCAVCGVKLESLELLKQHAHSHKDETATTTSKIRDVYRLFECDSCKKVFTTKSVLERHIFTHTQERQYDCKVCDKRFKQAGHVKSHMLVHTGERPFECPVCSKRFSLSSSLKKHMYVHNGDKPYQCDVCGARFLEKRNLNGHLLTHTNERPFQCKICGKRYTLADTLRRHVSAAHEIGRSYQCEICAKMFKQLAHLSVHKKVHNDERPFQCHLCEKNFKHKNVLKSHLAIHANVRPFECDVCKATFARKTNLQTHISSAHMNERPYSCTICGKRFKQSSHLNGHVVVHSNLMPYKCDYCDRRCNRLDNLKKHMRLHTKNKE
ncbi:PREDICTED: zinc finger protein 135-like isoform X2 [Vollenhovia emeryi]|uniref:zinc finger protein 135-like isoform X2 n=1 Tax=Vollenhovia emeryi TaxID=411798 RepID=UPI0005F3B2BA|nr:PREDICTED: zinc finger protein 135-like isoform X2 [Vollenhovia emeryi]